MKSFSKFKKQIDNLFVPELKMEFCCYAYPMRSERGNASIPRFCIKLGKEIIWDCPKGFNIPENLIHEWSSDNGICDLVRDYIDTPIDNLLETEFEKEKWHSVFSSDKKDNIEINYHLTEIFKVADKRLGKDKLIDWVNKLGYKNSTVNYILEKRFFKKSKKEPSKKSKHGSKYIVFRLLPKDQQKEWKKVYANDEIFTCGIYEEEKEDEFCPNYSDYEKFYDAWVEGRIAVHLD
jgi:hypothetical protein